MLLCSLSTVSSVCYNLYMANARKADKAIFHTAETFHPRNEKEEFLVKAFLAVKDEKEVANFLRDLLTPAEIEEFANRLEIVRLLSKGLSYQEIAGKTGVSTTTVSRVAHWYYSGCSGYNTVIERLLKEKK